MATLTVTAKEKSTYVIVVTISDEDDAALIPNSLTWTLTNDVGTVINSRDTVSIAAPASVNNIVLSGLDLAIADSERRGRVLTVEGLYDSSFGNGLPLKGEVTFEVTDLVAVE